MAESRPLENLRFFFTDLEAAGSGILGTLSQIKSGGGPNGSRSVTIWVRMQKPLAVMRTKRRFLARCFCARGMATSKWGRQKMGTKIGDAIVKALINKGCDATAHKSKAPPWDCAVVVRSMPFWLNAYVQVSLIGFQQAIEKGLREKNVEADVLVQWQEVPQDLCIADPLQCWTISDTCSSCEGAFGILAWRHNCWQCGASCCRKCVVVNTDTGGPSSCRSCLHQKTVSPASSVRWARPAKSGSVSTHVK